MQPAGRPRHDGNQRNSSETVYLSLTSAPTGPRLFRSLRGAVRHCPWAVLAWRFGVPTSESYALVAGLTGAACLFLPGGLDNIRAGAWGRVLLGLILPLALGWWVGGLCRPSAGAPALPLFLCRWGQLAGRALWPLHGAQDGQKFCCLSPGAALAQGGVWPNLLVPGWLMLLCAAVMALGTAMGGGGSSKPWVGTWRFCPREGLAADLGRHCLLLSTLAGLQ